MLQSHNKNHFCLKLSSLGNATDSFIMSKIRISFAIWAFLDKGRPFKKKVPAVQI